MVDPISSTFIPRDGLKLGYLWNYQYNKQDYFKIRYNCSAEVTNASVTTWGKSAESIILQEVKENIIKKKWKQRSQDLVRIKI